MAEQVRIQGISRLDSLDLKRRFPGLDIDFEPVAVSETEHGELATVAVLTITLAGIQALASWLMKDRTDNVIEKTVEVVNADGSTRKEAIRIHMNESSSQADVVRELGKAMNVDIDSLSG